MISLLESGKEEGIIELYDGILGTLWDASLLAQADVKKQPEDGETGLVHGYVTYTRLDQTISRTLVLIDQTLKLVYLFLHTRPTLSTAPKPEGVIKLYDTILLVRPQLILRVSRK